MYRVSHHFPFDYGGFILLLVPVFQLRGLVPREQLVLLVKTEAKKALSTSVFSSSFVTVFPSHIQERMEILLNIPVADVFIESFFIVFSGSDQVKFQMGFGPSSFLPAKPNNILVVVLSCLSLLPKDINNKFFFIYIFAEFFKISLCVSVGESGLLKIT